MVTLGFMLFRIGVKLYVERHGGTVAASNAPDGGAIFEFLLPCRSSGVGPAVPPNL